MSRLTQFGNALYTGEKSFDFVGNRVRWYLIGGAVVALAIALTILRGGFSFGIEFRGGSEFRVSQPPVLSEQVAVDTVNELVGQTSNPRVSIVGGDSIRVQTEQLTDAETTGLRTDLAEAYDVSVEQVTASFVGATWGQDITRQALIGLGRVFGSRVDCDGAVFPNLEDVACGPCCPCARPRHHGRNLRRSRFRNYSSGRDWSSHDSWVLPL